MKVLMGIAAAYLMLVAIVYLVQRKLQYFPSHIDVEAKGHGSFKPWLDDKGEFLGYVRVPKQASRKAALIFHGNGGEALHRSWMGALFAEDSYVFLAEYPGYGAMKGTPTETSIFETADRQAESALRVGDVVVVGESLGSGAASYVASTKNVKRLALIAPFTSAVAVGQMAYKFLPVRWLMKDRFDNETRLSTAPKQIPLAIAHGTADDIVPIELGRRLLESASAVDKVFVELPGVGHNDIAEPLLTSPEAEQFRRFLRD